MYIIPDSKEEALNIINNRRDYEQPLLKYDMFLGGLICASQKEWKSHRFPIYCSECYSSPYGGCPTALACSAARQAIFVLPWNEKY
jgi:hypothetical protein